MQHVVFTDIDGTLLDYETHSIDEAREGLNALIERDIPVIMVTSWTRMEVELLQRQLGISQPFITENGGGIYFPKDYRGFKIPLSEEKGAYNFIQAGMSYSRVIDFYQQVRDDFGLFGYSEMSPADISRLTKHNHKRAMLCKMREFSEPFIFIDEMAKTRLPSLEKAAQNDGMKIIRDMDMNYIIGGDHSKGTAVRTVLNIFRENLGYPVRSIVLGDTKPDEPMLALADIPVLVMRYDGSFDEIRVERMEKTLYPGPSGWNKAIMSLMLEM